MLKEPKLQLDHIARGRGDSICVVGIKEKKRIEPPSP